MEMDFGYSHHINSKRKSFPQALQFKVELFSQAILLPTKQLFKEKFRPTHMMEKPYPFKGSSCSEVEIQP